MPESVTPPRPSDAEWESIEATLQSRQVPSDLRDELRSKLNGRFDGLLLYGSWARGDAGTESDLDTIALNFSGIQPSRGGKVSLANYGEAELREMSGTLFGYHLRRDGLTLSDPNGHLARLLASIDPPLPGAVAERIRTLTPVLDVSAADRAKYVGGLTKVARYMLRSALYAEALDQGMPCFSVREIAQRKQDPALVAVLSSHEAVRPAANEAMFDDLRGRISATIGPLQPNPFVDLHGLIEGAWTIHRELSNFATLALANDEEDLPYDELPKVTL